jgi:hypothetical protein
VATPQVFTYSDAIDAMDDFCRGHGGSMSPSQIRRSILAAYDEFASLHDWSFLIQNGRVQLHATYSTGTVVYDATGGATCERQLTLTTGTWPTWANNASILFDGIVCDVERWYSGTPSVVSLDATMAPGADVASTTYKIWPRWYALPVDFVSMARPMEESALWQHATELTLPEMFALNRYEDTSGDIAYYAIGPAPDLYSTMALFVLPQADAEETLDFPSKRRLRQLRYTAQDANDFAGTIAVTAGSATVTGTSTQFDATHVGSVLRISKNSTRPTGMEGGNPWVEQRSIIAVQSTTSLTLDAGVSTTRSAVKYSISDPLDLEVAAYQAFLRCSEHQVAVHRNLKGRQDIKMERDKAVARAKAADSRSKRRRVAGPPRSRSSRFAQLATNRPQVD